MNCIICKKSLPEEYKEVVCTRDFCKTRHNARVSLSERIKVFKDFFEGKVPNEENYKTYFNLIGKEEGYQSYVLDLKDRGFVAPSRRSYYKLNVISVHADWPDEFGRRARDLND